jgi:hypothetical protein
MLWRASHFILLLNLLSCGEDSEKGSVSDSDKSDQAPEYSVEQIKEHPPGVQIRERVNKGVSKKILNEFEKPLHTYPLIEHTMAEYGKDGLLYRKGVNVPFSGRMIHSDQAGNSILEASFLDGRPHGRQIRKNEGGLVLMEAWMDRGVLSGVKTKWWKNGKVHEEEYWENGSYQGRSVWDESGRLLKQERSR